MKFAENYSIIGDESIRKTSNPHNSRTVKVSNRYAF